MDESLSTLLAYYAVPGRGLVTRSGIDLRLKYLHDLDIDTTHIQQLGLSYSNVQSNIESLIGSVEIPVGLLGPILFEGEYVHAAGATLEGALVASMNRGAKAISVSGGFTAKVIHQRMIRGPLLILENVEEAAVLKNWVEANFAKIKGIAEGYSNHAELLELECELDECNLHVRFVYTTGDASGQNMTTSCTWHALLWLTQAFQEESGICIGDMVLEGNASSDKKASNYLVEKGRGIKVIAECHLKEEAIRKVLRTTSFALLKFLPPSKKLAIKDGMLGYNINTANAVAAIFAATGQDLASIHESSLSNFELEAAENGLKVRLTCYSLVIGTVGGGTHLPKQQEALQLMGCAGSGKVERFAALIAGFAMGLDLSTYAALASGEFAKAHEKLGRNKPVEWLQMQEITPAFVSQCIGDKFGHPIAKLRESSQLLENGILSMITKKVNRKIMGFISLEMTDQAGKEHPLLIKSKPLDIEVIKGLHLMAASIDPELSDLIYENRKQLEYEGAHLKELRIMEFLDQHAFRGIPGYFGKYENHEREIYLLFEERLNPEQMRLMDSENRPEEWKQKDILAVLDRLHQLHTLTENLKSPEALGVRIFDPKKAMSLYQKMINIVLDETDARFDLLQQFKEDVEKGEYTIHACRCLIHNDMNPRNVAIRLNGDPCIYDWELAVMDYPQRDLMEFLAFVLPPEFAEETVVFYLKYYFNLAQENTDYSWDEWKQDAVLSLKRFLVCRLSFYKTSEVLMKLKFVDRVFENSCRMISYLEER